MGISERRKRETEALRQRVLDEAEEIFAREGIENVTMRRIAARIEYAPTVLYRLFESKTDLMDNLIIRGYGGVRARYQEVLKRKDLGPLEALTGILRVYVDYALGHPNHYRMWFDTGKLRREDGSLKMGHDLLEYVVFQTWVDRIEACQAAGMFTNRNPQEAFQVIWSRVHGLISLRIQHPDFPWVPVEHHLETVLDFHHDQIRATST